HPRVEHGDGVPREPEALLAGRARDRRRAHRHRPVRGRVPGTEGGGGGSGGVAALRVKECRRAWTESSRRTSSWLTRRARSLVSRGDAEPQSAAGPGCVLRGAERSSPGSTFIVNVVSSGGISAHPAAKLAGRGRLHPVNAASP